jgi:hypothetical protein
MLASRAGATLTGRGAANNGGQRGRGGSGSNGDYILRVNRFEGTISGLRKGELTIRLVEDQIDQVVKSIDREVSQLVIGLEIHKNPRHAAFEEHVHFVLEVDRRLYHKSSIYRHHI